MSCSDLQTAHTVINGSQSVNGSLSIAHSFVFCTAEFLDIVCNSVIGKVCFLGRGPEPAGM